MEEIVPSFFPDGLLDNSEYRILVVYPYSRAQNFPIILDLMKRGSFFYEKESIKKTERMYFCGLKWIKSDLQILSSLIDLCTDKIMLFYQKRLLNQYHAREAVRCMCEAVKFKNKNIWCRNPLRLSRPNTSTAIHIIVSEEGKVKLDEDEKNLKKFFILYRHVNFLPYLGMTLNIITSMIVTL